MDTLPLFRLTIDEDASGMDYMGLVDHPAHGKGWVAFSKMKKAKSIKKYFNEDERIVTGVAIATNLQIYRRSSDGFEYNVYFTKEDTKTICQTLFKNGYMHNVNEMHDMNKDVSDIYLFESFLINDDKSNIPDAFEDQNLQPGSWIVSYKVDDDDVWEKIKNGEFYGFSIEGWFKEVETNIKKEQMKKGFALLKGKFATIQEISKWDIEVFEDDIAIGTELHWKWEDWDGNIEVGVRIQDGEYQWDGHTIQVDSNGVVVMIDGQTEEVSLRAKKKAKTAKTKNKNMKKPTLRERLFGKTKEPKKVKFDKDKHGEATTVDGVVISWEGDAPEVGGSLFIQDADSEEMILADEGEYSVEIDGTLWLLAVDSAGLISTMEEVEEEEEEETEEAMQAMKSDYEKKLSAQKKDFDKQLKDQKKGFEDQLGEIVSDMELMQKAIDDNSDPEKGKKKKQKHSNDGVPGWKKLNG